MNYSINLSEAGIVYTSIDAAAAYAVQQTSTGKVCIKAEEGAHKAGDEVRVALNVVERVGTGRNAKTEHIGYAVELHKIAVVGEAYYCEEMKKRVQNCYF